MQAGAWHATVVVDVNGSIPLVMQISFNENDIPYAAYREFLQNAGYDFGRIQVITLDVLEDRNIEWALTDPRRRNALEAIIEITGRPFNPNNDDPSAYINSLSSSERDQILSTIFVTVHPEF